MKQNKSSFFNLNANIVVLIAYLGGLLFKWLDNACYFAWAIPLIIYLIETKNEFVKKQSAQATLLYLANTILSILAYILLYIFIPKDNIDIYNMIITGSLFFVAIISIISSAIAITITIFAIVATIKTYNYEDYEIPYLSKYLSKFREILEILEGKNKKRKSSKDCTCENCHCQKNKPNRKVKSHKIRKKDTYTKI